MQNKKYFRYKGKIKKQPLQKQIPAQKLDIVDARNKIISRKRIQITDAREKLAELARQKDARLKLQHLREKRVSSYLFTKWFNYYRTNL